MEFPEEILLNHESFIKAVELDKELIEGDILPRTIGDPIPPSALKVKDNLKYKDKEQKVESNQRITRSKAKEQNENFTRQTRSKTNRT